MDDARPAGSDPEPWQEVAAHYRPRLPRTLEVVRPGLGAAGPIHHLGLSSDGMVDFTLDVLDAIGRVAGWVAGPVTGSQADPAAGSAVSAERVRAELRRITEELSLSSSQLERRLEPLRSGALIRLVLLAGGTGFYCFSLVPGQYLVGVKLPGRDHAAPELPAGDPPDDPTDWEMSRIVTKLREQVGLLPQNPGGHGTADKPVEQVSLSAADYRVVGDPDDLRLAACRETLAVEGVHYAAYWQRGMLRFAVDILEHEKLDDYFTLIDPAARRRLYREIGGEFPSLVGGFGRALHPIVDSPPDMVVLDVEQGALYYDRIRRGEYLVAVTLTQHRVSAAEAAVHRIARRLRETASEQTAPA